jgi:rRNA maturation RNase YbeY
LSDPSPPVIEIFNVSGEEVTLLQEQANRILNIIGENEQASFEFVEVVFVDEAEIVRINKEHLDRDYVTDIISFRYDDEPHQNKRSDIEGTLFCCSPRIKEQASEFDEPEEREFRRILIHGLLHLIGYEDSTDQEKQKMTALENTYLALLEANI